MCRYVGTKTNNEAEYLGLIAGMQEARRLGCQSIEIRGDSQLVINQIQDNWKVKADSLRPYHQTATDLYQSFPSRTAHHIPRCVQWSWEGCRKERREGGGIFGAAERRLECLNPPPIPQPTGSSTRSLTSSPMRPSETISKM